MVFREPREVNLDEEWVARLPDEGFYRRRMGNWDKVLSFRSEDRTLTKLVFGLVRPYGYTDVEAVFSDMWRINYRAEKKEHTYRLELSETFRSMKTTDLLKFVRYAVYDTLGIGYVPDVHCFSGWVCPKPLARKLPSSVYTGIRPDPSREERIRWGPSGKERDLLDSVQRLLDSGLLSKDDVEESYFCWSDERITDRLAWCNGYSGVVFINSIYDSREVPYQVLDLLVYHECLHLRQKNLRCIFREGEDPHDAQFRAWERKYPQFESVDRQLNAIALKNLS